MQTLYTYYRRYSDPRVWTVLIQLWALILSRVSETGVDVVYDGAEEVDLSESAFSDWYIAQVDNMMGFFVCYFVKLNKNMIVCIDYQNTSF